MHPGQWGRVLTVHGDGRESRTVGKTARSTGARQIGEGSAFFDPTYPAVDGSQMGFGEHGNGAMVDAVPAQGGHGGALLDFALDQGAPGRCAERLGQSRERVFQAQEDFLEVFFTAATS